MSHGEQASSHLCPSLSQQNLRHAFCVQAPQDARRIWHADGCCCCLGARCRYTPAIVIFSVIASTCCSERTYALQCGTEAPPHRVQLWQSGPPPSCKARERPLVLPSSTPLGASVRPLAQWLRNSRLDRVKCQSLLLVTALVHHDLGPNMAKGGVVQPQVGLLCGCINRQSIGQF